MLFALLLGGAVTVQAANTTVKLNDTSGNYLEKTQEGWFLKSRDGRILKGIQYLRLKEPVDNGKIASGYYYFTSKGYLAKKSIVTYQKNRKIGNRIFDGYYYTNGNGRLCYNALGLREIRATLSTWKFDGIYRVGEMGKIQLDAQISYLPSQSIGGKRLSAGYYYFRRGGKLLDTPKNVYNLKMKSTDGKKNFVGHYCFGDTNGRLVTTEGWYLIDEKAYYVNSAGKLSTNCWKDGYYLLANGTIARSRKVPGGYVDCDGRLCSQANMSTSSLKNTLEQMAAAAGGQWGIYVKDLKTGTVVSVNGEGPMYPASSIKAYVMAATYDKMSKNQIADPAQAESILDYMIYYSDNNTYNQLTCLQTSSGSFLDGAKSLNEYLQANGYTQTGIHHTLHPSYFGSQSDGQGNNTTSAKDGALLLERIYRGTCVSPEYSAIMRDKLENHSARAFIPACFPGIRVIDKPGFTDIHYNDMAVVYGPKTDVIISIFSTSAYNAVGNMQQMALTAYHYFND